MFDLVGKRYLFILISLIVIVPGTISLIVKGLNVGIDFVGGANVEYRPEKAVTIPEMTALVAPFKLEDLQVVTGDNPQLAAGGYRLDSLQYRDRFECSEDNYQ